MMFKKIIFQIVLISSCCAFSKGLKVHPYNATHNTSFIMNESAFLNEQQFYIYSDLTSLYNPWIDLDETGKIYQGTIIKRATLWDLGVGYLATPDLQINFNIPLESIETEKNVVNSQLDGTTTTGLGDARFFAKWNFLNLNTDFGFTLIPEIYLPTGFNATNKYYATAVSTEKTGVGASWGSFGAGLKLAMEYKNSWMNSVINIGYEHHPGSSITGKSSVFGGGDEYTKVDHVDRLPVGLSFLFRLSEKWGLNLEGNSFLDKKQNEYTQPGQGYAGLKYNVTELTSVHAGYGGGLGEFTALDRWTIGMKMPFCKTENNKTETLNPSAEHQSKPHPEKKTFTVVNKKIEFDKSIQFKTGSSELTEASKTILNEVVDFLNQPELSYNKLYINGHTDHIGDDQKNKTLSEKRALSVKQYLMNKNIPKEKLVSQGLGESKPLVVPKQNMTKEDLLKNRRVEFIFE